MQTRPARTFTALAAISIGSTIALVSTSCSLTAEDDKSDRATGECGEVVLVTHDSFDLPKKLVTAFEKETGCELTHSPAGDGGELTSKLVVTEGDPIGDVAFGVDNTFAGVALDEGVFAPYRPSLPSGADRYLLSGDDDGVLTPIDNASVCVNVDVAWFDEHGVTPPTSLDDLTDATYRDLLVTESATTSSTGLAFLLATIGEYGDDWASYWQDLLDNGAKIDKGWEDAYYVDFSFSGGDRPIVVSYDTSPAYTVKGGKTSTSALLDTCFRQVEYAGVLEGAANPVGAEQVVDWLLSPEVQAALPTSMYVFPVDDSAPLPKDWASFATSPSSPIQVDPADIAEHRREWLTQWTDLISE
ncbi:thiamine ABC transporter substrate-binding protein [Nocardioides humilatus]|uniref:Thiamine ABC transporter substrate-binding protein n=1 Tax=Nocardioides humilatus TaxID=2607660 RepID=A0A5B1LFZ1_9ACTN|nr:thiamine ABC transporter substrate-binding protein [Nocardioides humilatus]KAA1419585.1 thiamine ABC transporter substrate-binding protein [Nocardioides humilatus]